MRFIRNGFLRDKEWFLATPNLYWMQFPSQCRPATGWDGPSSTDSGNCWQLWKRFRFTSSGTRLRSPLVYDLLETTFLSSWIMTTHVTSLRVDTLNSSLRYINKSCNFTRRMAMGTAKHDCPFLCPCLPLSHSCIFPYPRTFPACNNVSLNIMFIERQNTRL